MAAFGVSETLAAPVVLATAHLALTYTTDIPHHCQLSIPSTPALLAEIDGALHGSHRDETRPHECRSWARMRVADESSSPIHKRPRYCDYGLSVSAAIKTAGGDAFPGRTYVKAGAEQCSYSCQFRTGNLSGDPNLEQIRPNMCYAGQQWKMLTLLPASTHEQCRAAGCSTLSEPVPLATHVRGSQCGTGNAMVQYQAPDRVSSAPRVDTVTTLRNCLLQLHAVPQPHGRPTTQPLSQPCGQPGAALQLRQSHQQQHATAPTLLAANAAMVKDVVSCDHWVPSLKAATCPLDDHRQGQPHQNLQQLQQQSQLQPPPPQQQQQQRPWPELSRPRPQAVLRPLACHLASAPSDGPVLKHGCSVHPQHHHHPTQQWELQSHGQPALTQQQLQPSWQQQPLLQQPLKQSHEQLQLQPQPQQQRQPYKQQPSIPFFMPATPPLDADAPSECILLLCKALCMSECTTARLALHIWNRIRGMVRLVLSVRTLSHVQRHESSPGASAAAADRVYSVAAVWLASKLEESRRTVPAVHTLAAVARTLPSVLIAAELRVLQWCEWSPYAGFVPDDSHLLIDL